ncbi:MAG: HAD-IG family 5'-nucleotidase, partial [Myxococcota bacterium]
MTEIDSDSTQGPVQSRRIFVNRNLRMDAIAAVGFDMDYTLARYRRERLERLGHELTIEKLISRGYPPGIRDLRYDPRFVIRGLIVDKELGNILKLDRHRHVGRAYHGREPLSREKRHELYRTEKLVFVPPRFAQVDTLFSLPEMCLYADLVNYFERHAHEQYNPWQIFDDVRESIDEAHRDDTLKSIVKANIDDYIEKDDELAQTLHKMRSAGKKLFLLTNSYGDYTRAVMSYLLDGEMSE